MSVPARPSSRSDLPCAVITGLACLCAAGVTSAAVMDRLYAGACLPVPPRCLGPDALPYPMFAVDEALFPDGRRHSAADTLALARHAAREALSVAGLEPSPTWEARRGRTGVILGTTAGSSLHFLSGYAASRRGAPAPIPDDREDYFISNPALALGAELGAGGPFLTVANACTSGTDALGLGLDLIRQGQCDCVLCGGAEALSMVPHTGFARLMIYDAEPCRPFDRTRRGLNLGEGAAVFVLESEARARRRGATALGRILGYGAASDAYHFTAPHPEGRGLGAALSRALKESGLRPGDLAFVNAHGTGTLENDKVEGGVLRRLLPGTPVWASKGATGHTLGAAGALEAALCLLALRGGRIPASWGFAVPDPAIGLCPTQEIQAASTPWALSTSLGFGGGNAALALQGECL